MNLDQIL